ncbi:hypothetical protein MKK69_22085 [Methylobacterium sp. J-026]|uniref:hypothetical protein n=1 Tax=Methylobacterium sp. J-026 TaxID=2836624 RepID=UPI001FBA1EE0|nr:hypothetical protein [Methylobacterium sp. J-026]MCJ2136705.1 hypothetical protein [Methylobacterium sp. J-026]
MNEQAFAILLASIFTSGCAVIQIAGRHPQAVTAILLLLVLSLGPFVGLVALAQRGEPSVHAKQPAAVHRLR